MVWCSVAVGSLCLYEVYSLACDAEMNAIKHVAWSCVVQAATESLLQLLMGSAVSQVQYTLPLQYAHVGNQGGTEHSTLGSAYTLWVLHL